MSKRGSRSAIYRGNIVKCYEGNTYQRELALRQEIYRHKNIFWEKYHRLLKNVSTYEGNKGVRRSSLYRDDLIHLSTNILTVYRRLQELALDNGSLMADSIKDLTAMVVRTREIRSKYVEEAEMAKLEIIEAPEELSPFAQQLQRALRV